MAVPNRQLAQHALFRAIGTIAPSGLAQSGWSGEPLGGLIDLLACIGARIMEPELVVMAYRHVFECGKNIADQIRRIRAMERRGDDTTSSVELLATVKRSLALHESHRENILEALGSLGPTVHA